MKILHNQSKRVKKLTKSVKKDTKQAFLFFFSA